MFTSKHFKLFTAERVCDITAPARTLADDCSQYFNKLLKHALLVFTNLYIEIFLCWMCKHHPLKKQENKKYDVIDMCIQLMNKVNLES